MSQPPLSLTADSWVVVVVALVGACVVAVPVAFRSGPPPRALAFHALVADAVAAPLLVALGLASTLQNDSALFWMLAPHDQARWAAAAGGDARAVVSFGLVVAACVALVVAAAFARALNRGAVDGGLGSGVWSGVGFAAPVVVGVSAAVVDLGVDASGVGVVVVAAAIAAVVVFAAAWGAFARVAANGASAAFFAAAGLAAVAVVFAGLAVDVADPADAGGRAGYGLVFWSAVGGAVVVAAGAVAAWQRAAAPGDTRIRGARHQPTPGLSQDLVDPATDVGRGVFAARFAGGGLVVGSGFAAVCGVIACFASVGPFGAARGLAPEPLWPADFSPVVVAGGDGRGADIYVDAAGNWGALPADDDLPAVMIDARAPETSRALLSSTICARWGGFILVGPRAEVAADAGPVLGGELHSCNGSAPTPVFFR